MQNCESVARCTGSPMVFTLWYHRPAVYIFFCLCHTAAHSNQVGLIGPATVGGIKPGCMRIGNTGGMLDNIVMSKVGK